MNPRHRRLLIPGLLIVLLVVVVVVSFVRRAEAAEPTPRSTEVSRLADPRITESSGLAISTRHRDLGYTINDSGDSPRIFAFRVSTGRTVGVTTVRGVTWRDTEAMALDGDGRLWVADTGDNQAVRRDVALYALDEPGPTSATVDATRYPLSYQGGPQDVESLAIDPGSGAKVLVTKGVLGGEVLRLPARLSTSEANVPKDTGWSAPLLATDAAWSPDGDAILVRNYISVQVLDARTGEVRREQPLPSQEQGETIAFDVGGRSFVVGSEGADSPLLRLAYSPTTTPTATAGPTPATSARPETGDRSADRGLGAWPLVGAGLALALVVGAAVVLRRSR